MSLRRLTRASTSSIWLRRPSCCRSTPPRVAALASGRRVRADRELAPALEAWRPDLLVAYGSVVGRLASAQLDARLSIAPRMIMVGADRLGPTDRARAEAAWGRRVFDGPGPRRGLADRPGGGRPAPAAGRRGWGKRGRGWESQGRRRRAWGSRGRRGRDGAAIGSAGPGLAPRPRSPPSRRYCANAARTRCPSSWSMSPPSTAAPPARRRSSEARGTAEMLILHREPFDPLLTMNGWDVGVVQLVRSRLSAEGS